VVSLGLVA
jgi:hypothetical protein